MNGFDTVVHRLFTPGGVVYGPGFVKGRVSHAIAPSLINTDAIGALVGGDRYGFNPRGQHVRRQVGEIRTVRRRRERYRTRVRIPGVFNALPSSLNQARHDLDSVASFAR